MPKRSILCADVEVWTKGIAWSQIIGSLLLWVGAVVVCGLFVEGIKDFNATDVNTEIPKAKVLNSTAPKAIPIINTMTLNATALTSTTGTVAAVKAKRDQQEELNILPVLMFIWGLIEFILGAKLLCAARDKQPHKLKSWIICSCIALSCQIFIWLLLCFDKNTTDPDTKEIWILIIAALVPLLLVQLFSIWVVRIHKVELQENYSNLPSEGMSDVVAEDVFGCCLNCLHCFHCIHILISCLK